METVSKRVIETYKNIYLGPFLNKKEKFQETSTAAAETSIAAAETSIAAAETSTSTSLAPTSTAASTSTSTTPSPIPSSTTPSPIPSSTTTSSDKDIYYTYDPFFTLIAYIMFFFAIYLSFKCNNGFSVWGFLGAFLFSPIYIIYKLTSTPKMCNLIK